MLLAQLTDACGGPGHEEQVRNLLRPEVTPLADEIRTDAMGNLIAVRKGPKGNPHVMLAAHMDEVCLMVTSIEKNGMLRFRPVGGIDPRVLVAKSVAVGSKQIAGVIGAKPIHQQQASERERPMPVDQLYIDLGCTSRDDAGRLVNIGDYAYFTTKYEQLNGQLSKGKAFDDRAGCSMLLDLLRRDHNVAISAAFTVQEEVGLRGAATAAYDIQPDLAVALEATAAADTPGAPDHKHATTLGGGPCLTFMDRSVIPNPKLVRRLQTLAQQHGIPFQMRRNTAGGTDAGSISLSRTGVPSAVLALPCRYIHSPVSLLSRADYHHAVELMSAFLHSLAESEVDSL